MRNPFRRRTVDPRLPHRFEGSTDPGIGMMGNVGRNPGAAGPIAAASAYQRLPTGCAVKGCGKPRGDDVHSMARDL
ncbi:MAG: hypothetical protein WCK58_07900 [Chloroflexota bacterium]